MERLARFLSLLLFSAQTVRSHVQSECYTVNGEDYRGLQNQTSLQGGKVCLFWNETFAHPYNTRKYPNGEGGLGAHNYCRNPDGDVRPWCYVVDHDDGVYWKFCDIPSCQMPGIMGCYKDNGNPPPLAESYQTSKTLTIQNCISYCRNQRYKLAGMESGYACFCGQQLGYGVQLSGLDCSHSCFGDQQQPCGGDGHIIVFNTKVGACGGNYTSMSDVIYSPDFPDKYSPGRVCYWTIQVPGASFIIFNFTFFSIMDQADMVEILDGYNHQVLARFDGPRPPHDIINITTGYVILYFYSDRTNQAKGFSLIYQAYRVQDLRAGDDDGDGGDEEREVTSTAEPQTNRTTENLKSSHILILTSSPQKAQNHTPGQWLDPPRTSDTSSNTSNTMWTVYALAALLTLTVIAMVAKLLLHVTVKSPSIPSISGSESCDPKSTSEPWIIFYRPTSISLFKKKLKNHHGDLSPLVSK